MKLKIKKMDATASDKFADSLRTQVLGFPPYLNANWDSIEMSFCDFLDDYEGTFEIDNDFTMEWLLENAGVYASVLFRLREDYPDLKIRFS